METPDEIWEGDLFNRRAEAEDLIGYLESVAGRPALREDGHAHVLAVDTDYGRGKTFFLKRLARHLQATGHVAAYVDAWVDDLEDEPIVALAATLDIALQPRVMASPAVGTGLAKFKEKAGEVAKIAGIGVAKRALGFIITQGAAEALGDVVAKAGDVTRDIEKDALKGAGAGFVDDASGALRSGPTPAMDVRIAKFREGQQAIRQMKASLAQVVRALREAGMKLPIVVVVDELDRCRPNYAIKALEEIKHLFDVDGVAFVLGMHGDQLAHSISVAYGSEFDSRAYLRRFFNRKYRMSEVELTPLIAKLLNDLKIPRERLFSPEVHNTARSTTYSSPPEEVISAYMLLYGMGARDAYQIVETLQVCVALTSGSTLILPYLLKLIVEDILAGQTPDIANDSESVFRFSLTKGRFGDGSHHSGLLEFARDVSRLAEMDTRELAALYNEENTDPVVSLIADYSFGEAASPLAKPKSYRSLLRKVAQFV